MATIQVYDAKSKRLIKAETVSRTDEEWKKLLTPKQHEITAGKGTEAPGSRTFEDIRSAGVFKCVRCGNDLFSSSAKFESGTGWPSFFKPVAPQNVTQQPDRTLGMTRTEVLCARCGAHLGHVFDDGPRPTGKRYCMNGFALEFVPEDEL